MACSICGREGHNSRSCPQKTINKVEERDSALWFKIDNITIKESDNILKGVLDLKSKYASNGRGTFARGNKNELPNEIHKALKLQKKG